MGAAPARISTAIRRRAWTLQRFGMTPAGLSRRLLNRGEPIVFCNSIPKSGTHLIERALCLHPRLYRALLPTIHESNVGERGGLPDLLQGLRPGQVLVAHLLCSAERVAAVDASGARSLLMIRDPRDIVVSTAHYAVSNPSHPWHSRYMREPDVAARIRLTIRGDGTEVEPIRDLLAGFMDWRRAGAEVVRFEDLVGEAGGGTRLEQAQCLARIYEHVGVAATAAELGRIQDALFSDQSPTFRRGATGQWRSVFDADTTTLFEREAGPLLGELGYGAG